MPDVLAGWAPGFSVGLMRDVVLPAVGTGFVLAAFFWVVGSVVGVLLDVIRHALDSR